MGVENLNYAAILADMKGKRSALDASISALETALAAGALGQPGDPSTISGEAASSGGSQGGPVDLPPGALMGKSVPVAIKLYLEATKRKQMPNEIADGIQALGVESGSQKFKIIVATALKRLRDKGEVYRFKDGWGLSSWLPPSLRNSISNGQKTEGGKKKSGKKSGARRKARASKSAMAKRESGPVGVAPLMESSEVGAQAIVEGYYSTHAGREMSPKEVATALDLRVQTVGLICAKLAHAGKLEKTATGNFRMAKVQQMPKAG